MNPATAWPEWAWCGRDRAHTWHVLRLMPLDGSAPTAWCGSATLNARREVPETDPCPACMKAIAAKEGRPT